MKAVYIILLVVAALLIGGISFPAVASRYAPYETRWDECLVCGCSQIVEKDWQGNTNTTVEEHEHSIWAEALSPGHEHRWSTSSVESRERWFGSSMVGCGGIGAIGSLYRIHTRQGEDVAAPLVEKYLPLAKSGNLTALRTFLNDDLQPAIDAMIKAVP